ncbi:MAG TPA: DNA sulfur modification protein DndB [Thermoleophilaceae bacterium]|jgi:DNA sulfur modification protein DndB
MAMVEPALKGKMGNTEFYLARIRARELVHGVRPARELDEWASMGIEERMQREPDLKRIKDEIAPYIAQYKDRFFGSLIVLVYKGEVQFESIKDLGSRMPAAYKSVAGDMGFVTIDGGHWIALDGQHRLLALEQVLKQEVEGDYNEEVADDHVSVIFVRHEDNEKTRRIFNRVNRYAKRTGRGDNIVTSEDDGWAIVSRRLLSDGAPLGIQYRSDDSRHDLIVDWKSNTLSDRSGKLTTISVVYETVKLILAKDGVPKFDPKAKVRPSDEELDEAYQYVEKFWRTVLEGLTPYKDALAKVEQMKAEGKSDGSPFPAMRQEDAPYSLLFKPAAQIALFDGLLRAMEHGKLSLTQAVKRANGIDWRMTSPIWRNIIIRPNGTIDPRAEARKNAAALMSYLIAGDRMPREEVGKIERLYNEARGYNYDHPPKGKKPDPLPGHVAV